MRTGPCNSAASTQAAIASMSSGFRNSGQPIFVARAMSVGEKSPDIKCKIPLLGAVFFNRAARLDGFAFL